MVIDHSAFVVERKHASWHHRGIINNDDEIRKERGISVYHDEQTDNSENLNNIFRFQKALNNWIKHKRAAQE